MVTDAKCVENLAGLSAVRGVEAEFQSQWPWAVQCTGDVDSCRECGAPQRHKNCFCTSNQTGLISSSQRRLIHDVQTPSMLSMMRLRRFAWYLVGGADLSPFFAYSDEPSTMLAWTDADWSGNAITCGETYAGAVQLESHKIEACIFVQQVVSFSSARK